MSVSESVSNANPFLQGNNEPVYEETTTTEMEVIGKVPVDISGSFLRVGPNPYYVPDEERYHIFDGDGMIHGIHFNEGKAT